jgi:hypothetical protein
MNVNNFIFAILIPKKNGWELIGGLIELAIEGSIEASSSRSKDNDGLWLSDNCHYIINGRWLVFYDVF